MAKRPARCNPALVQVLAVLGALKGANAIRLLPLSRPLTAVAPPAAATLSMTAHQQSPVRGSSSRSGGGDGGGGGGGGGSARLRISTQKLGRRVPAKNWRVVGMYRQAQTAISAGEYDEARTLLEKCLELDARDAYCWLSLARLEARTGDEDHARARFEDARATCPDNVRLVHAHAIFEQRAGRPHVARQLFAEAAELEPANAYVSHAWGQLEEAMGNVSAAQRIYADLMAVRPQAQVR